MAAMATTFLGTDMVADPAGPLRLLRAMAEAGIIGGLADWFAVTALFRRPLGLPIPHTALLPRHQARAATNVGRFPEFHFLQASQIEARMGDVAPSGTIADWLDRPGNTERVARQASRLVEILLRQPPSPRGV